MDTNISIICQAAQEDKTKVENEGHRIKSQIESNQIESKLNSFTHALLLYKASKSVFTIHLFVFLFVVVLWHFQPQAIAEIEMEMEIERFEYLKTTNSKRAKSACKSLKAKEITR